MAIPLNLTTSAGAAAFTATNDGTSFSSTASAPAGSSHIGSMQTYTVQTVVTSAPTSMNIKLQGSLDNATWADLGNTTSIASDMFHVTSKPVAWIRASVTLAGGTSPSVTVYCLSTL